MKHFFHILIFLHFNDNRNELISSIPKKYKRFGKKSTSHATLRDIHKSVSIFRQTWEICNCYNNCSSCKCVRIYYTDQKFGTQTLYRQFFFSWFNDIHMKATNCCCTVGPNQKVMTGDFRRKLTLKRGDINNRVKDDLVAVAWTDNQNILTKMHCLRLVWKCSQTINCVRL